MQPSMTNLNSPPQGSSKIRHRFDVESEGVQILGMVNLHQITFWTWWIFIVELTRTWTWKSRIVAIFLLFLTLWHVLTYKQADAALASLSILKYEALKWPHRVIRGSKIKSASILFKSMSDDRPWLKNSKNVIIFQMRHVVLTLGVVKGQRLVFRLYRGQKIKLLRFSWKWWQIVHLLERI